MLRLLGILFLGFLVGDTYKILVYNPTFGHSHSNFMGRIADILVEAGHNVTTIVTEMDPEVADGTKLSTIIRVPRGRETTELFSLLTQTKVSMFELNLFNPISAYFMGQFFGNIFATQCRELLATPGLVEQLKSEKYDVYFTENFDMCGVGLVELIKPRSLISISSFLAFGPMLEEFGIPAELSHDPVLYVYKMNVTSMWDRIVNIFGDFLVRLAFGEMRNEVRKVFAEKFGEPFPSFKPLIDFATPTISRVISIGGIGAREPKELSEDWLKILSKREETVILSLGSIAKSAFLPLTVKMSIIETMKALPHVTFIWKYEEDDDFTRDYATKLENLVITKWMPQVDLFGHSNLSLFITHGGMGSTQETAIRGVPGLFIPLFGDQPRNAGMMEHNKLGKVLDKTEITDSAKFVAAIREVLEDESYRRNARRVSAMLHKRPFTAKEQLIKYTEFAAEFGPSKALRPQSHDMNWIEYHNVDILVIVAFAAILCIVVSVKIVLTLIRKMNFTSKIKRE